MVCLVVFIWVWLLVRLLVSRVWVLVGLVWMVRGNSRVVISDR